MNKKKIIVVTTVLCVLTITILSLIKLSQPETNMNFTFLDKIVHFVFYFILNALVLLSAAAYNRANKLSSRSLITLASIAYGIGIEIIQLYVGREFSLLDILANSLGAIAALVVFYLVPTDRIIKFMFSTKES